MLCARRANHFLSTDKNSFVHGGVLPEEVIVPYMTFEPVSVPLQDLEILMKTNQYRYRLENIEPKIGNPNDAAVEQVQLACLNGNVDWDFQPITLLNGHHAETRQVQARFRKSSLRKRRTSCSCACVIAAEVNHMLSMSNSPSA